MSDADDGREREEEWDECYRWAVWGRISDCYVWLTQKVKRRPTSTHSNMDSSSERMSGIQVKRRKEAHSKRDG